MSKLKNEQNFLVTLTLELGDALEDLKYHMQRKERRRVTKRELVEKAIRGLVTASASGK